MWNKTRFQGVRYRESKDRRIKVKGHYRPDRCFYIYYKMDSKSINEKVGWESEGILGEQARDIRGIITSNIRKAEGYRSLKEKREIDKTRKEQIQIEEELKQRANISFGALAQEYLNWAEEGKKSYKDDIGRYQNHLSSLLSKKIANEIGIFDIVRIKKALDKKALSPATVKHCVVLTRQIFNHAISLKLFSGKNPVRETLKASKGFLKQKSDKRTRFLSQEEAKELLKTIKESSMQTYQICCVSLYTGLRMGEIFALTWQDVDLTNKLLYIRNPKNDTPRHAYLTPVLVDIFKKLSNTKTGLIFPDRNGKRIAQLSENTSQPIRP
jgi:integrase